MHTGEMVDRELIIALTDEVGDVSFCGGHESADLETARAFVRFVHALPDTRIHPDDIRNNSTANWETDPRWSALALEYVFSDQSAKTHADIVVEFMATLTASTRTRLWRSVRTQIGDVPATMQAAVDERALAE